MTKGYQALQGPREKDSKTEKPCVALLSLKNRALGIEQTGAVVEKEIHIPPQGLALTLWEDTLDRIMCFSACPIPSAPLGTKGST